LGELTSQIRCIDGRYREDCSFIKYTSCSQENPFRCPDGRCVTMMIQCASHICPADRPIRCVQNLCSKSVDECSYGRNLFIARSQTFELKKTETDYNFYDVRNGDVYLGCLRANKKLRITVEGVGMSEVGNSTITPENFTEHLFEGYLAVPGEKATPVDFIRSAIVRLKGLHQEKTEITLGEVELYLSTDIPFAIESKLSVAFNVV